jgi:hypothetical protein
MKLYQVVLESGGKVIPRGHTPYAMAAKQLMDNEVAPGRAWALNGMGANVRTMEVPSATGGRGKPMKMYLTPIISFGYGLMRGYSQANHQPDSSNGGWINPGNTQWISPLSLAGSALRCRKRTAPGPRQPLLARFQVSSGSWSKKARSRTLLKPTAYW